MKKIAQIIDNCKDCKFCQRFNPQRQGIGSAFICEQTKQLLRIGRSLEKINIPDWCPLETYSKAEKAEAQPDAAAADHSTLILPGMPHLEWMTENLTGHGGTEVNGHWYYTYDEAEEAVKQLGNGWRLPTRGEMLDLDDLGSTWDDERKGRWFGGNHDTDHKGSLFLPATGFRHRESGVLTNVGGEGDVWASSSYVSGNHNAGFLGFLASLVLPLNDANRARGLSVRCVRNVK